MRPRAADRALFVRAIGRTSLGLGYALHLTRPDPGHRRPVDHGPVGKHRLSHRPRHQHALRVGARRDLATARHVPDDVHVPDEHHRLGDVLLQQRREPAARRPGARVRRRGGHLDELVHRRSGAGHRVERRGAAADAAGRAAGHPAHAGGARFRPERARPARADSRRRGGRARRVRLPHRLLGASSYVDWAVARTRGLRRPRRALRHRHIDLGGRARASARRGTSSSGTAAC